MSDQHASLSRAELEAQIAEYQARGGKIEEVPIGVSVDVPPEKREAPPSTAAQDAREKIKREGFCTAHDIAKAAGVSSTRAKYEIRRLGIETQKTHGLAQFYSDADGALVAKSIAETDKAKRSGIISSKAAKFFGVKTGRFLELVRLGKAGVEPIMEFDRKFYFDKDKAEVAGNAFKAARKSNK